MRKRSRTLDAGIHVALALVAIGLLNPGDGLAGQEKPHAAPICHAAVAIESETRFKVRLAISSKKVSPGDTVRFRLENTGAVDVAYGPGYQLQKHQGKSWVNLPTGPSLLWQRTLRSGDASGCRGVRIAKTAAPGVYRLSKAVWPVLKKTKHPLAVLRTTFRVVQNPSLLGRREERAPQSMKPPSDI